MQLSNVFLPNRSVDTKTRQIIVGFWLSATLLLWLFSPFTYLPRAGEVWNALGDLWTYDNLGNELFTSFKLNLETIGVATLVSLGLTYLSTIGFFRPIVNVFGRLRYLSMVGLSFFFVLMTSSGHELKLGMLVFSVGVFFVTGMVDVLRAIPKEQFDLAKTLRMGDWETLWEVCIIGQIDKAFEVLRQNAAVGWMMLSFCEAMDRSEGGIGAILTTQQKHFHMAAIFAIQILVLCLGLGQDYALVFLRKICCPYADLQRSR
jgi:NitT/TauT family transport system permease protein